MESKRALSKALELINDLTQVIKKSGDDFDNTNRDLTIINPLDEERRLITGVVMEPDIYDSHGDTTSASEIERACYDYMEKSRRVGVQHSFIGPAKIVENWITKEDCYLGKQLVGTGTWLMTVKVDDSEAGNKVWDLAKQGKITGFSIGGEAEREEIE